MTARHGKNLNLKVLFLLVVLHGGIFKSFRVRAEPAFLTVPSNVDWVQRDSSHFHMVYPRGRDKLALKAMESAEKAHRLLRDYFPQGPQKTWILLTDFKNSLNGYALNLPYPHMVIFASSPEATSSLASMGDWLDSVILHEYVHTLHIYPVGGFWKVLRTLFGSWVLPNGLMPRHFHEGMAVLLETRHALGGRGKSAHYEMITRMAVEEGKWGEEEGFISRDRMDGTTSHWPYGRMPYYFGYQLSKALFQKAGKKGIFKWADASSHGSPYFVSSHLKEAYNLDFDTLWNEIFETQKKEKKQELHAIKQLPLPPLRYLTQSRHEKDDLVIHPQKPFLFYTAYHPESGSEVVWFDLKSKEKKVISIRGLSGVGMCLLNAKTLVYVTESQGIAPTRSLVFYDLEQETSQTQTHSWTRNIKRVGCGQNTLALYTEEAGQGELTRLKPNPSGEWKKISHFNLPLGDWVTSIALSQQDWFVLREKNRSVLYQWPKRGKPKRVEGFKGHVYGLAVPTSKTLSFIADFEGRFEAYEFHLAQKKTRRIFPVLGGLRAYGQRGKEVFTLSYRHGGYDVAQTWQKQLALKRPAKDHVAAIALSSQEVFPSKAPRTTASFSRPFSYSIFPTIWPKGWIPSLLFVPDGLQLGAAVVGYDLAQTQYYQITGGYDTRGSAYGMASYNWRFLEDSTLSARLYYLPSYLRSLGQFYSRWGGSLSVSSILEGLDLNYSFGVVADRTERSEFSPRFQSVGLSLGLSRTFGLEKRPNAVSPHLGTTVSVSHQQYFDELGSQDDYFETKADVSQYLPAPWSQKHAFKISTSLGWTEGSPLLNAFYQGGGELQFYINRTSFLNRGFLVGQFAGRRMFTLNLEYRFPILEVERGPGYFPFYLKRLHGALVSDWLSRDGGINHPNDRIFLPSNKLFREFFGSVGLELKSDWKVFFYVPTSINLGLYHGFGDRGQNLYLTLGVLASL